MTREQAINYLKSSGMTEEQIETVINALTCEDCISREETIEWLKKVTVTDGITFKTGFEQILYDIEQMPSVTPKFTDDEIQKMQELEQAQLDKAYELGRAEMQPSEDCTSEEVTDIILSIARNLEHICEVIKNDKGRSNRHATNMDKKCR